MARAKRSNFEREIAKWLTDRGIRYQYESDSFVYYKRPYKPKCLDCGSTNVASVRVYTPDFYLPDYGFWIEAKGKFGQTDRKKMSLVKRDNPDLDVRIVFMTDNKMGRGGTKRYSDWAEEQGFQYSIGEPDDEWF